MLVGVVDDDNAQGDGYSYDKDRDVGCGDSEPCSFSKLILQLLQGRRDNCGLGDVCGGCDPQACAS